VDALPSVLLLRHFYDRLMAGEQPAAALSHAASWLRDLDRAVLEREVAALCRLADDETAFHLERGAGAYGGEHPFATPIFWAAFTFNGVLAREGGSHV
jgi:CHAT domain-containing protein